VAGGDVRRRPASSGAEIVRVLDGVLRRRAPAVRRPLRQRGNARPEVIDAGVQAAQLTPGADAQSGDEADEQRNNHAEDDDQRNCTGRVETALTAFQRLIVTRIYRCQQKYISK